MRYIWDSMRMAANVASYRVPAPVMRIRQYMNGDTYPICPRCELCLDREYMRFCSNCGQRLDWGLFSLAQVQYSEEKNKVSG